MVIGAGSEVVVTDPAAAGDMAVIEIAKVTATGFTTTLGAQVRRRTVEGVGRGARPGPDTGGVPPVGGT